MHSEQSPRNEQSTFKVSSLVEQCVAYRTPTPPDYVDIRLDETQRCDSYRAILPESVSGLSPALTQYPNSRSLEAMIANRLGVNPAKVVVTAGADDALMRIMRVALEPGRSIVLHDPIFDMVETYARLAGGELRQVRWFDERFPVDKIIAEIDQTTMAIAVVSPNNPTGATAAPEDICRLSAALPNGIVIVDEVYGEYADEMLTPIGLRLHNVVLIRTFSKCWGLAGLRIGYAVGPEAVIESLRRAGGPYPISTLSLQLTESIFASDLQNVQNHIAAVKRERAVLFDTLTDLGASPYSSQSNFILARFRDEEWTLRGLAALGIWVRRFPAKRFLEGCLRLTCPGNRETFERLLHALRVIFRPQAVLLDMDGVIANVRSSYREAICMTASSFGVPISAEAVQALKNCGDSSNDWTLTKRILEAGGVRVSLDDVTNRFEEYYQGTAARPGLFRGETMLPQRQTLERLAKRCPVAVVTGRPRKDAVRFLQLHQISEPISSLVCLEDAPAKPDTTPVRLALSQLSVDTAWMVGDTVDDIRAARLARVLPIGIASQEDRSTRAALLEAGAACILENLDQLLEIMP